MEGDIWGTDFKRLRLQARQTQGRAGSGEFEPTKGSKWAFLPRLGFTLGLFWRSPSWGPRR